MLKITRWAYNKHVTLVILIPDPIIIIIIIIVIIIIEFL